MTRYLAGVLAADTVVRKIGNFYGPNAAPLTLWDSFEGGTQHEDLSLDEAGTQLVSSVTSDAYGAWSVYLPEGVAYAWVDDGNPNTARTLVVAGMAVAEAVSASQAQASNAEAAALAANTAANDAQAAAEQAQAPTDDMVANLLTTDGSATSDAAKTAIAAPPSYVATVENRYEATRNIYNFKAGNTRNLRAALGNAQAGLGLCEIACIGDSETSYKVGDDNGDNDALHMWPRILADTLGSVGLPDAGTGSVPIADSPATYVDPRWTLSGFAGTTTLFVSSKVAGSYAEFDSGDDRGTVAELFYFDNTVATTTFDVSIDGGPATQVVFGGAQAVKSYKVTGLTDGPHTIRATVNASTGANNVNLLGAAVYDETGVLVHNLGLAGSSANGNGIGKWADDSQWYYQLNSRGFMAHSPAAVVIALGVNDLLTLPTIDPALVIAALTKIRNHFPDADCILTGQYQPSGVTDAQWEGYLEALYGLADTLDVPLLDLYDRHGDYAATHAVGLVPGAVHPSVAAQADWGRCLGLVLAG